MMLKDYPFYDVQLKNTIQKCGFHKLPNQVFSQFIYVIIYLHYLFSNVRYVNRYMFLVCGNIQLNICSNS